MTSSLVGSEMCIRDSCRFRLSGECGGLPQESPGQQPRRPSLYPGPLPPVSYTHLTLPTICSV
eukprot:5007326-Prorocentrum_lima.AAC.1